MYYEWRCEDVQADGNFPQQNAWPWSVNMFRTGKTIMHGLVPTHLVKGEHFSTGSYREAPCWANIPYPRRPGAVLERQVRRLTLSLWHSELDSSLIQGESPNMHQGVFQVFHGALRQRWSIG